MRCLFLLAAIVGVSGFSLDPRPVQSVGVRGVLICGGKPAPDVLVKLVEKDVLHDTEMGKMKTDSQGRFELTGYDREFSNIDPKINIYHHCDNKGFLILPRCARKFSLQIPDKYITRGNKQPSQIMDVGVINLEVKYGDESHDCIHRV